MFFIDVQIIREDKTFTTSAYRRRTFSGVYTHCDSFLQSTYRFGTVYCLKMLPICLSWTKLHTELVCLKQIFFKSDYPENFNQQMFQKIYG